MNSSTTKNGSFKIVSQTTDIGSAPTNTQTHGGHFQSKQFLQAQNFHTYDFSHVDIKITEHSEEKNFAGSSILSKITNLPEIPQVKSPSGHVQTSVTQMEGSSRKRRAFGSPVKARSGFDFVGLNRTLSKSPKAFPTYVKYKEPTENSNKYYEQEQRIMNCDYVTK